MARRKASSTVYIVSIGAHVALGLAIALIPKEKLREVVGIAMAENKKPPPKIEAPPRHEEPKRARTARSSGGQRAQAAADVASQSAPAQVFTDIGIALDSSAEGGIPMQIAPKAQQQRIAPTVLEPPKPKVLTARVSPDACSEELVKARVLRPAQPKYPAAASLANVRGQVRVELEIDEKGVVKNARILRGLGYGIDEAAVEAAKKVEFRPATLCGKPVSSKFTLAFRY